MQQPERLQRDGIADVGCGRDGVLVGCSAQRLSERNARRREKRARIEVPAPADVLLRLPHARHAVPRP